MSDLGLIDCFCVLTWSAAMQISCKKRIFLHIKELNPYSIFFCSPTWLPLHFLYTNMATVSSWVHDLHKGWFVTIVTV